jgi:hypothetical protein
MSFELKASFIESLSVPVKTTGHELYRRLRHDVKCSIPIISSLHPSRTIESMINIRIFLHLMFLSLK